MRIHELGITGLHRKGISDGFSAFSIGVFGFSSGFSLPEAAR
jgi:hypothetical protein